MKIMLLVDANSLPVTADTASATPRESRLVQSLLDFMVTEAAPERISGDKAYDSDALDPDLATMGRGSGRGARLSAAPGLAPIGPTPEAGARCMGGNRSPLTRIFSVRREEPAEVREFFTALGNFRAQRAINPTVTIAGRDREVDGVPSHLAPRRARRGLYPMTAFRIWRYTRRVKNRCLDQDLLLSQLKYLIVDMFRLDILEPDKIADDQPLIGGSLCLDSLDALELAICVEEEFGIAIRSGEESHSVFTSIASLADFIHAHAHAAYHRPGLAHRVVGPIPLTIWPS